MSAPGELGLDGAERGLVDDGRVGFVDEVAWQLAGVGMAVQFCNVWPVILLQDYAAGVDFIFEPFADRLTAKLGSPPRLDPFSIQLTDDLGFSLDDSQVTTHVLLSLIHI